MVFVRKCILGVDKWSKMWYNINVYETNKKHTDEDDVSDNRKLELKPMTDELKEQTQKTISSLLSRMNDSPSGIEAMQYAQAILNLTQAHTTYSNNYNHYESVYGFQTEESKKLQKEDHNQGKLHGRLD